MGLFHRKPKKEKIEKQKGTVDYNAHKNKKRYPTTKGGYFGEKGNNRRVIYSENQYKESKRFYSKIGKGGVETPLPNKHGVQKTMKDGGKVVYREKTSTKESPAVDLGQMQGKIKNQRIHFERRKHNGK
jgi:hypothetical protein